METQNKLNLIADRYADALIALGQENSLAPDTIKNNLSTINEILRQSNDLKEYLNNPTISADDKKDVITKVFSNEIDSKMLTFLNVLVDKNRFNTLKEIESEYKKTLDKINNISQVHVTSAIELNEENKRKLKEKLETKLKKSVNIDWEINPDIIAGLIIAIGDNIIDTSLKQKLEDLKKNIVRI